MNKKYLLSSVMAGFALLYANQGMTQCLTTQDCTALGYIETSCPNGGVKCPFGNSWACFKSESEICNDLGFTLSCTGTNQTGGVGKTCNGKYNYCTCTDGYKWDATSGACISTIQPVSCIVGTLYYSDGTCYDKYIDSKTLLGIVIYEKSASQNGWIMTVKPIQTDIAWDTGSSYLTSITDKAVSASCTNTQKLVALGSRFAAANAANNYKPTGTPSGKSWCLPSYDLLNNITYSDNFAKVNAGITTAGGTTLGNVYNGSELVWSSSEYGNYDAWEFSADTSGSRGMYSHDKDSGNSVRSVRPVLAF